MIIESQTTGFFKVTARLHRCKPFDYRQIEWVRIPRHYCRGLIEALSARPRTTHGMAVSRGEIRGQLT